MKRHYVLSRIPNLEVLDDTKVTDEEKAAAMRLYGNLPKITLDEKQKKVSLSLPSGVAD